MSSANVSAKALVRALKVANSPGHALVLYDGLCNVCNASIQFVVPRVPDGNVLFASLQSDLAKQALHEFGAHKLAYADADTDVPSSSVVVTRGKVYNKLDGSVQLLKLMEGWPVSLWPVLGFLLSLVPRAVLDVFYDNFAKNRFKIFGGSDAVQPLPAGTEDFFLDAHESIHVCPVPQRKSKKKA